MLISNEHHQAQDNKSYASIQKADKIIETTKIEVKTESVEIKTESQEVKMESAPPTPNVGQMFSDGVQRVITQNQQIALQVLLGINYILPSCFNNNILRLIL